MVSRQTRYNRANRELAIQLAGGKCQICGTEDELCIILPEGRTLSALLSLGEPITVLCNLCRHQQKKLGLSLSDMQNRYHNERDRIKMAHDLRLIVRELVKIEQ